MTAPDARQRAPCAASGRGRAVGVPGTVWALCVLHLLLLVGYSILVPTYRAPDEPHHVDLVLAVSRGQAWPWPDPTARADSRQMLGSLASAGYADPSSPREREVAPLRAADAVPRSARPSFSDLGPDVPSGSRNQMTQHPPLYYLLGGVAVTVSGAQEWPFDRLVGALRLGSALLVAALPLLAYLTARGLRASPVVSLTAAVVPLAVPQLTHLGSTASNDALLVALLGVLTVLVARVLTGDARYRTAVLVGLVAGLALLTKGFALLTPAWLALVYAWAARRDRRALSAGVLAMAIALASGGWWWLRNVVRYGTVQPDGLVRPAPSGEAGADLGAYLHVLANTFPQRFWGSFGWLQVSLPWPAVWLASAVVAASVVGAFATRPRDAARGELALMLFPLVATLGIVLAGSWSYYRASGAIAGIQGRYLLTGIVGLAVVVAAGLAGWTPARWQTWLPAALLAAGALLQTVAIVTLVRGFWMEPTSTSSAAALAAVLAWSPWPPAAVAATCLAAATGALLVLDRHLTRRT